MKKAVVLLSGGMDSAVCMAVAKDQGYKLYTLTIDYGQRNKFEIEAAEKIANFLGTEEHLKMDVDLRKIGGSALTDNIEVPEEKTKGVPVTYVPARNLIFLSIAAAWAEVLGADSVFIGVNVMDYSGYPDCRVDFLRSFENTAKFGTKKETRISIKAPLLRMSKSRIVKKGNELGIDFSLTSSCYNPGPDGAPCGKCDSCRLREKGFREAELLNEK